MWVALEVTIALARSVVLILAQRSRPSRASVLTDLHIALSLGWAASVGYGVLISMGSGDWVVATLSCLSAAAMVGGVCFRSFSAPRLVCIQISLLILPLMVGAAFSGEPILFAAFLQGPIYLAAMGAAAFQLNRMLIGTLRAKIASEYSAKHDPLTGLLNRAGLDEVVGQCRSETSLQCGVLFIDLDDFKVVNDTHGHAIGDRVLKVLAGRLRKALPRDANAARLGGDEFVVILKGTSASQLYELAALMTDTLCRPLIIDRLSQLNVFASVGAAFSRGPGESIHSLIERADREAYDIKYERKQAQASRRAIAAIKELAAPSGIDDAVLLSKAS
jgi:diguanylate cyclase (GGDEF)-like protein